MLVVMERAKIRAGGIGRVDRVVGQNVIALEVSGKRRTVNRTTIEQFTDTQCFGFPPSTDWMRGRCAVRRASSSSASACGEPVPSLRDLPAHLSLKSRFLGSVGYIEFSSERLACCINHLRKRCSAL